jgi:hypothetical protein
MSGREVGDLACDLVSIRAAVSRCVLGQSDPLGPVEPRFDQPRVSAL